MTKLRDQRSGNLCSVYSGLDSVFFSMLIQAEGRNQPSVWRLTAAFCHGLPREALHRLPRLRMRIGVYVCMYVCMTLSWHWWHILQLTAVEQRGKLHRRSTVDFLVSFAGRLTHLHASPVGYLSFFRSKQALKWLTKSFMMQWKMLSVPSAHQIVWIHIRTVSVVTANGSAIQQHLFSNGKTALIFQRTSKTLKKKETELSSLQPKPLSSFDIILLFGRNSQLIARLRFRYLSTTLKN